MGARSDRTTAFDELASPMPPTGTFGSDEALDLPAPARRLLASSLIEGAELTSGVVLTMEGEIKLKGWTPFRARQVVRAGTGFVWDATVGRGPLRFVGADTYHHGRGSLDFRLWGLIPVARASGPDVDRSARGRLAAETVAWLPQALTPAAGARWTPVDDERAVVTVPVDDDAFDVTVSVDAEGHLRELSMLRWGDPDGSFAEHRFGSTVEDVATFDGVTIASAGRVAWHRGSDRRDDGEFFRYRITDARHTSGRS